jgi:hypothetical protein
MWILTQNTSKTAIMIYTVWWNLDLVPTNLKNQQKNKRQLSHDDLIVTCSGTNDYDLNDFSLIFQNIKNYIKSNNHTSILLMNVPFWYDVPNSFSVNKNISVLNRKLQKLVKVFPHTSFLGSVNNRKLFTNQGLHRNKLGKKLVNFQLAFFLTTFNQKTLPPIPLGWYETCEGDNLHCDVN